MFKILAATVLLGFAAPPVYAQTTANTATLTIDCKTTRPAGAVLVALFDDAEDYTADTNARYGRAEVVDGRATIIFDGLTEGEYGFKMFHDLDGDGRMSMNPFGMPTEPYAFSNNAVGNMGPANWDAARFTVAAPATAHSIRF